MYVYIECFNQVWTHKMTIIFYLLMYFFATYFFANWQCEKERGIDTSSTVINPEKGKLYATNTSKGLIWVIYKGIDTSTGKLKVFSRQDLENNNSDVGLYFNPSFESLTTIFTPELRIFVSFPVPTIRTPSANGSRVPPWPTFLSFVIDRIFFTISNFPK